MTTARTATTPHPSSDDGAQGQTAPPAPAGGTTTPQTGPSAALAPEVAALSYEQARDELVAVVSRLESGAASLEASLELWERGEALADRCQAWLDGARQRLERASSTSGDTPGEATREISSDEATGGTADHESPHGDES